MNTRTKITSDKFSVSIYQIANSYGFKTIGKFHKFLQQCQPNAKLYLGTGHMRVNTIRKEVENLLK
jgi:hypothetical protein